MKTKRSGNDHLRKRYLLRHVLPATVWLTAVGAVVWLFYQRAERFQVVGIAQGQIRQIAMNCTGRIRNISVDLFEPVQAGQTVAIVDTLLDNEQTLEADLRAQLAVAAAEAERLVSLLIPTQDQLETDMAGLKIDRADNERRFAADVENTRVRILELQATTAFDRGTLEDLGVEVKILEDLLSKEAIAPYEVEKARIQFKALESKVRENEQLLEQAREDLRKAEERRDLFGQQGLPEPSVDHALEAIRKEITVQEELMKGLLAQLTALETRRNVELTSPIDGVVIAVHGRANDALQQRPGEQTVRRAGEVIPAGDPILAVAELEPTEIVAYVNEAQLRLLKDQMTVKLVKAREPAQIAESQVLRIGPVIELMPQRLWVNPNVPQWGRPVLIGVPAGLSVVSGEVVGISGL
ncbi:MAG: HlyD family efflux transporter periplasmic adaptor subunit [Sedimentisphaerales bacterium]|jgi:multidrug resistance efflux pump|nr:HlyD family efflux transporter periplasmic adaptor subunit [Sedimentisphaerales bacterium]HNY79347.1 HlyD family efflux transporter periplasmic adaptor subunit [Sedimentisphaerales bacterium]HOC64536.1 HlyD family efflux transporter periplasmic adaptor subunit [Sedimentisphaerales bacterium]HOH65395.1 HlyD family efflux transporter periplasmic adaptor subunit [Sedimentisphaerales bacterium]HPY52139.1 HlyD family efflux transporter periplasmic adaptor subunit [Sedimentisphaerales bacterium]